MNMTRVFKRKLDSLEDIHHFILDFAAKNSLDKKTIFNIDIVVEELFANAVKHNPGNTHDVTLSLSKDSEKLIISVVDEDVDPFDIRQTEAYDPHKPLEERRVGGVGIPLIKQLSDDIAYEYQNRQSRITLIKYLEKHHV